MSIHHKSITTEGVAPCPLCGTKVQIVSEGKLCCFVPGEDLPVYNVRCKIECPTDFLTLDLGWSGYADAENKTEQEQRGMLSEIMRCHAEQTRKIWNKRAGNSQPVRHGFDTNESRYFHCSECDYGVADVYEDGPTLVFERQKEWRFCPNCGAKLDAEVRG